MQECGCCDAWRSDGRPGKRLVSRSGEPGVVAFTGGTRGRAGGIRVISAATAPGGDRNPNISRIGLGPVEKLKAGVTSRNYSEACREWPASEICALSRILNAC